MSRLGTLGHNLYTGKVSYDFVGRWRRWVALSGTVIIIGLVGLGIRGLSLSIDFKGGASFTFPDKGATVSEVTSLISDQGLSDPVVTKLSNTGLGTSSVRVETAAVPKAESDKIVSAIASHYSLSTNDVSVDTVGSDWGRQITEKAVKSLIIFLIAIVIYLSLRYEWKMASAAIIALIHDLIVTTGIYALVGFDVSPSTVIGLLTILGYSLYDTVVVFDKVRENTREITGGSRMTYSQSANLAVNQTLVRSINTSVIALLPVASLLFVGAGLLGAGALKDLALALFIGLATGTYSSIFIATPLVVLFKEREPQYQALTKRVAARRTGEGRVPVAVAAAAAAAGAAPAPGTVIDQPRAVPQKSRQPREAPPAGDVAHADDVPPSPARPSSGRPGTPSTPAEESVGARPASVPRRPAGNRPRPGGRPSGKKRRR